MTDIELKLEKLSKSKFRSKFHLSEKDQNYIDNKGLNTIRQHTKDFVIKNLLVKTKKDGKQTPYKGHPVFISQHATGTCCRECLYKWHQIPTDVELNEEQISYIVNVIMTFIKNEI